MSDARHADGQGTIEVRGERVYWRIGLADGSRPRIPLKKGTTREQARTRLDEFIAKGLATGKLDEMVHRLLEKNPRTKRGRLAADKRLTTVREVAVAWLSGELFAKHGPVNGLRPVRTGRNTNSSNALAVLNKRAFSIRTRGAHGPMLGDLACAEVESDPDVAAVMAKQPMAGKHRASAGTRNHVHSYLARIFSLAEIPLGLRKPGTNPVLAAYRAPKDPEKLYNYLYPSEVLALLGNRKIPLGRRVLYVVSNYFGWRKGTLNAFRWGGIDWDHGTVSVLHQKGRVRLDADENDEHGVPIFFHAEPGCVLTVLRAWWEHCGRPGGDEPVFRDLRGPDEPWREDREDAKVVRADLRASSVKREILFSEASNVQQIRFHDGRATFRTWARRAGKSDTWITERTGHTPTTDMLRRYTRMAQSLADLRYEPFPDLTSAIPELAPKKPAMCADCAARLSTALSTTSKTVANGRGQRSSGPKKEDDRGRSQRPPRVEVLAPEMG